MKKKYDKTILSKLIVHPKCGFLVLVVKLLMDAYNLPFGCYF